MFSEYFEFDDAQYLTRKQVARILGIHPSTVTRWVESNDLPLPIRLGPNRTVWSRRELEAWRKAKEQAPRSRTTGEQEPHQR